LTGIILAVEIVPTFDVCRSIRFLIPCKKEQKNKHLDHDACVLQKRRRHDFLIKIDRNKMRCTVPHVITIRMNDNCDNSNDENDSDEVIPTVTANDTVEEDTEELDELKTIFDDEHIEKYNDKGDGKPRWRCKWCQNTFASWNATKALAHVVKTSKADIKACTGRIDDRSKALYERLYDKSKKRREQSIERVSQLHNSIVSNNKRSSIAFSDQKKRRRKGNVLDETVDTTPSGITTRTSISTTTSLNHENFKKKLHPLLLKR
jgi:transposase-like protein